MASTIWKFPLAVTDFQKVEMPHGAEILTLQAQNDVPTIWARVNPYTRIFFTRHFYVFGTGEPLPDNIDRLRYVGTCQTNEVKLVWHVYEDPQ